MKVNKKIAAVASVRRSQRYLQQLRSWMCGQLRRLYSKTESHGPRSPNIYYDKMVKKVLKL